MLFFHNPADKRNQQRVCVCDVCVCECDVCATCVRITQVQSHSAVQPAGRAAPARHAERTPGNWNLQRQVAGRRRFVPHQGVGRVQELGVRHRLRDGERDELMRSKSKNIISLSARECVLIYPAVGVQLKTLQAREHLQGGGDVTRRVPPPGVV